MTMEISYLIDFIGNLAQIWYAKERDVEVAFVEREE